MQLKYHMVTIEDLVPENHFLRKLEAALDLSFVYEETAHLYSRRYGRAPIDPVVMVKYLLLGFLYGIPSERQIEVRCADSNAFRWYLGRVDKACVQCYLYACLADICRICCKTVSKISHNHILKDIAV